MNYQLVLLIMCLALSGTCVSVRAQLRAEGLNKAERTPRRCRPNPDSLYDRSRVLLELADTLNQSIPEWSRAVSKGFYSDNERGVGFFVVDLTNPSNRDLSMQDCVNFINGHVYHVAPSDAHYSLSHIVILEEGKLKVFRSVNCPSRGDPIEDAIKYVGAKLSHDKQRDEIIGRVRNYRKYGVYGALHHGASICKDPK